MPCSRQHPFKDGFRLARHPRTIGAKSPMEIPTSQIPTSGQVHGGIVPLGPEVSQKLAAAPVGKRRTRFPPQLEPPVERILGLVTARGLNDSPRPKHENWHTDTMLDSDGCGAEN